MKLAGALLLLATAAAPAATPGAAPAAPAPAPSAALEDRLAWNARERTATGVDALRSGRKEPARQAFDRALALRPGEPVARYNSGTARIGDDDRAAAALLEPAARQAPEPLAPAAWYNLGNARLGSGDASGAVDAYVEALKRRPDWAEAKYNLELALREQARQKQDEKKKQEQQPQSRSSPQDSSASKDGSQQKGPQGKSASSAAPGGREDGDVQSRPDDRNGPQPTDSGEQGDQQQSEAEGKEGSRSETGAPREGGDEDRPSPSGAGDEDKPGERSGDVQREGAPGPQRSAGTSGGGGQPDRLAQFHDLPDMSAEQAAAILKAVENLERAQRRAAAIERHPAATKVEKDW